MNCCIDCFYDSQIRSTIELQRNFGDCDFCDSKNIAVIDVDDPLNPISEKIIELLQLYSASTTAEAKPLKIALRDDWDIFTAGAETLLALTKKLCANVYDIDAEIYSKNVIIEKLTDKDFLREYGIVRGYSWDEFSESIKYGNRFHSGMFNSKQFISFIDMVINGYPAGMKMYRARICPDKKGYSKDDMNAPPKDKRTAGRINPEGIGVLYLSSDKLTILNEVRASAFDHISIGTFQAVRDIRTVNLSGFDKTSPFKYDSDLAGFAANRKVFKELAAEVARPLRRSDSNLEYLPTQYITEFIKSQNFDGVVYDSTLRQGGYNLAIFNDDLFECVKVQTIEVSEILYKTQPEILAGG